MNVKHLYRSHFIKLFSLAMLCSTSIMLIEAEHEAVRNTTGQRSLVNAINIQNLSTKKNTTFLTNFRKDLHSPRAKLSCAKEIDLANKFIMNWAKAMDGLVSETVGANDDQRNNTLVKDAALLRESFNAFGANLNKQPIEKVIQDLVTLKRRTNRLALSVYLKTYNPLWPQNSAQLASTVERVQLACMPNQDRAAMLVLNSPFRANGLMQFTSY